jgi:hypothetical protein
VTPKTPKEQTPHVRAVTAPLKFEPEASIVDVPQRPEATETKSDAPKSPTGKTEEPDRPADGTAEPTQQGTTERDLHFRADSPTAVHPASLPEPPAPSRVPVATPATTLSQTVHLLPSPIISEGSRHKPEVGLEGDETMVSGSESESDDEDTDMESDDSGHLDDEEDLDGFIENDPVDFLHQIQNRQGIDMDEASSQMDEGED